MLKRLILFLPAVFFCGLAGLFFRGLGSDPAHLESVLIGKPLPSFSLPALEDENVVVDEQRLAGKAHLINFWGTYCPPCRFEHPYLIELSKSKQIPIVGVNYNDDPVAAREWLASAGNPFIFNVSDTEGRLGIDMGVIGAPETFLIDQEGIVRKKYIGILNERVWEEEFVPLLSAAGAK